MKINRTLPIENLNKCQRSLTASPRLLVLRFCLSKVWLALLCKLCMWLSVALRDHCKCIGCHNLDCLSDQDKHFELPARLRLTQFHPSISANSFFKNFFTGRLKFGPGRDRMSANLIALFRKQRAELGGRGSRESLFVNLLGRHSGCLRFGLVGGVGVFLPARVVVTSLSCPVQRSLSLLASSKVSVVTGNVSM